MFLLNIAPKITKELLLSKYSAEQFFEFYLGITVKKGLLCSPSVIRNDKTPTCAFYKDQKGNLKYKDFAGPTFDFVGCEIDHDYYECAVNRLKIHQLQGTLF